MKKSAPRQPRAPHRALESFYVRTALHEYLTNLADAFVADAPIDVFNAEGRHSRPLPALEAETDR